MRAVLMAALLGAACVLPVAAEPLGPMARTKEVLATSHDIVVGPGEQKQKVKALNDLLRTFLDTDAMGRGAMGRHLDGRSPAQVRAFLDLFRDLFVRTYVQRLLLFDAPDFGYREEKITGDTATVGTEIITPKDRFAVDYAMRRSAQGWRATDILVEDASLGDNFRSQFDAALAKESFESLMERLRKKMTAPEKSTL
jgi:phospholipid transport system substrate-binding protein